MDTRKFKKEFLTKIQHEGFKLTDSDRAVGYDGKYDLDKLFGVADLDSDTTLKEVALQVIDVAKELKYDPGFVYALLVQQLGSVIKVYASKE